MAGVLRHAMCSATAAAVMMTTVTGCAGPGDLAGRVGSTSAETSQSDLGRAVEKAEGAVEKDPRSAGLRAELASAYLQAGRFESAATTYRDAIALGSDSPGTALGLALAHSGSGRHGHAVQVLDRYRDSIPASDLGLAYALAGQTERGVAILAEALRGGENHAKLRQNLAYAYALAGRWLEARLMAGQDIPANQLDARISSWAMTGRPGAYRQRMAGLLGAPVRSDRGQPQYLALNTEPAAADMAVATIPTPVLAPSRDSDAELPAIVRADEPDMETSYRPTVQEPAEPSPPSSSALASEGITYIEKAVIQPLPRSAPKHEAAPRSEELEAAIEADSRTLVSTHLVQLGSFLSPESARRAWKVFQARNPGLVGHDLQITEALVGGRHYWRVAAAGFDDRSARSMCSSIKGRGGGCIAYAVDHPLPGVLQGRNTGGPMKAR